MFSFFRIKIDIELIFDKLVCISTTHCKKLTVTLMWRYVHQHQVCYHNFDMSTWCLILFDQDSVLLCCRLHNEQTLFHFYPKHQLFIFCQMCFFMLTYSIKSIWSAFPLKITFAALIFHFIHLHLIVSFCEFFHEKAPSQMYQSSHPNENCKFHNDISCYLDLSFNFFSDSLNAFTSFVILVLQEPNFSFSIIFLNMLYLEALGYIPA